MIGDLGAPELLVILLIVVLLFGAGKVGRLGKDLGTSVREFRSALRDDESADPDSAATPSLAQSPAPEGRAAVQPPAATPADPGASPGHLQIF